LPRAEGAAGTETTTMSSWIGPRRICCRNTVLLQLQSKPITDTRGRTMLHTALVHTRTSISHTGLFSTTRRQSLTHAVAPRLASQP
jgi:hypothetical protein